MTCAKKDVILALEYRIICNYHYAYVRYQKGGIFMLFKKQKKASPKYERKHKAERHNKTMQRKHFSKEKTSLFENVVSILCWPSTPIHCAIATIAVGLGFFLNEFGEMPLFWLKAIFGFILYMILVFAINYLRAKHKALMIELTGDPNLVKYRIEYTKKTNSNYNFILCFIAGTYFVGISVALGFVQKTPIGIYSSIALFFVVFCAFVVFQQYIYILFLLYKISRINPGNFYELIPERTNWFYLLEQVSHVCRNFFIVLGSLFILLFLFFLLLTVCRYFFMIISYLLNTYHCFALGSLFCLQSYLWCLYQVMSEATF